MNTVRRLAGKKVDPLEYERMVNSVEAFNKKLFAPLRRRIDSQEESSVSLEGMTPMMRSLFQKLKNGISWIEGHRKPMQPYVENRASHIFQALEMLEKYGKGRLLVVMDEAEMISLQCAPKNVGSVLEDKVWSMPVSFVLTSGTVSDEGDFEHFLCENGLQRISKQRLLTYCVPSPFCYERHTRLYIPNDMPFPDCDSNEYIEAVAARIASLVKATNGHTAVLFTSYKLLNAVYESIQGRLNNYNIFCMTRNNKNAIQDFRNSPNGVLFASGAMWEGVDFAGDCLSSVIIPRLPFPIRGGMSQQKKEQYKDAQDFIWKYVVPEMVTKLRQGVGRLIRTETDTGVVSILDARAYQGMYKDKVAGVLQKYPVIHSVEEVRRFFRNIKPQEYFDDEA